MYDILWQDRRVTINIFCKQILPSLPVKFDQQETVIE